MRNWHLQPASYTTESTAANYQLTVTYHYDASGALSQVTGPGGTLYWEALERDPRGQLVGVLLGNRIGTITVYDPATGALMGRTSGVTPNTDIQSLAYKYDVIGNLKSRKDVNQNLIETFTYDNLNRLTESDLTANGATSPNLKVTYDDIGNIKSQTGVGTYTYDPAHPHAVQSIDPTIDGVAVTHGISTRYAYDANGNTLSGNGKTYAWTAFNKPWKIDANGAESQFWYGPDRSRYKQVTSDKNGVTTTTLYIGGLFQVIAKDGGTTTYRHNIIADGKIIAIYSNTSTLTQQIRYLHYDVLGSVNAVTDGSGALVTTMSFSGFGQRRDPQTWQVPEDADAVAHDREQTFRGYTNQEELDAVGLIHMNGRVYDPQIGRFTSTDPFVQAPYNSQDLNRYSYVWNNPTTYTDPTGFFIKTCVTIRDRNGIVRQSCTYYPEVSDYFFSYGYGYGDGDSGDGKHDGGSSGQSGSNSSAKDKNKKGDQKPKGMRDRKIQDQKICTVGIGNNSNLHRNVGIGAATVGGGFFIAAAIAINTVGFPEAEGAEALLLGIGGEPVISIFTLGANAGAYGAIVGGAAGCAATPPSIFLPVSEEGLAMKFLRWMSNSLLGHFVMCEVFASGPFLVIFLALNYADGTLTMSWAWHLILIAIAIGLVGAPAIWYTITGPHLKRVRDRKR